MPTGDLHDRPGREGRLVGQQPQDRARDLLRVAATAHGNRIDEALHAARFTARRVICDADFNGDCIENAIDLLSFRSVFFTAAEDQDLNGDNIVNAIDLGLFRSLFFMVPGPSPPGALCAPWAITPGWRSP